MCIRDRDRGVCVTVMGLVKTAEAIILSVTVILNGKVPAAVGMPEIVPVFPAGVKLSPGGSPMGIPQV